MISNRTDIEEKKSDSTKMTRYVLPKKAVEMQSMLLDLLNDPAHCYQTHPGQVLIGVYNIVTEKISLLPCMHDSVWLEMDPATGLYVKAWRAEKNQFGMPSRGAEVTDANLSIYNDSPYPPRIISNINESNYFYLPFFLRPHTFLIELLNATKNISQYRGFSVIPPKAASDTACFLWNSASLNSTLWLPQTKIMSDHYKHRIEYLINALVSINTLLTASASINDSVMTHGIRLNG